MTDILEHAIVHPYTTPRTILSDNGTPSTAGHTQIYARKKGITWKFVAAYNPQGNGKAERMVRTIKNAVAKLIYDKLGEWDRPLYNAL